MRARRAAVVTLAARLLGLAVALDAAMALAAGLRGSPPVLHLEGTLAADQAAAGRIGFEAVSLGLREGAPPRWLGVVTARTLAGDSFRGRRLLEGLAPYRPMLRVAGPPALVKQLEDVPVGTHVVLEGLLEARTRNFLLSVVGALPEPTKAP